MRRIIASDFLDYPFAPEMIYAVLADIPGYKKWWPWGVRVKVLKRTSEGIGSKIEVWASGGWFRCETTSLKPNERVDMTYYTGVVQGESYWSIEARDNGRTRVYYTIDLEPKGLLFRMLSEIINISAIHSWQFKRVLKNLYKHLSLVNPI